MGENPEASDLAVRDLALMNAVHQAMRLELQASVDELAVQDTLRIANVLLERAELGDACSKRRVECRDALTAALGGADADIGDVADPYAAVSKLTSRMAGGELPPTVVQEILRILAKSELPEMGVSAPAELAAREESAMNWFGRSTQAGVTREQAADYLAARFGPGITVHALSQLSGGFSKTTLLLSIQRPGEDPEQIVLRQISPGRDGHTLKREYDVVRYVWEQGGQVAEPLWMESEENSLGGPFFASRRALGSNLGDVFGPQTGTGPEAARGLAVALGRIHAIPVDGLPETPVPSMSTRDELRAAIDEQRTLVEGVAAIAGEAINPLHDLLFDWLQEHVPNRAFRNTLLHGDPGFHNMLVHEDALTAMLDWERARVGDPVQDLAYVRPHVTKVQPWSEFLDAYCAAGGHYPDEDTLHFYSVWHDAWRFAGAYRGLARLSTQPRTLLDGVLGLLHAPRFLMSGVETAYGVAL